MTKYYKVVDSSIRDKFYSFNIDPTVTKEDEHCFGLSLEYSTEYWTKPVIENSKLFVFDSLDSAISLVEYYGAQSIANIFECEVKNPKRTKFIASTSFISTNTVVSFWNNHSNKLEAPHGTVVCDEVKLIKRVV